MMGWISPKAQAAHLIAISCAAATYMFASGISAAVAVRVGNHLGLKDREGIRMAGFTAFGMVIAFMSGCSTLLILFHNILPMAFTRDSEVLRIASSLLLIAAFFQLWDGMQVVALGALRGLKDTLWPTLITIIAYWVLSLPLSYFLAFRMN